MPRLVLPLALAALLLAAIAPAQAQGLPNPLGLHGFNLGMTLAEVRGQKFPGTAAGPAATGAKLICSGDGLSKADDIALLPGDALREIGVKGCRFFDSAGDGKRAAPLKVGGQEAEVTFLVSPKSDDPAASERLYLILAKAGPAHFDDLVAAYTAQLGPPNVRLGQLQIWQNGQAALMINAEPSKSSGVAYVDKALSEKVTASADAKAKPGADKKR